MSPIPRTTPRSVAHRALVGLLLAGVLAGCSQTGTTSDPPPAGEPPPASGAIIVSGDNQVGLSGKVLLEPLVIQVLEDGRPAVGVTVTWTASDGWVMSTAGITDSAGKVAASWRLGELAGRATLTATTLGGTPSTVTFGAISVGSPSAVLDRETLGQVGTVGTPLLKPLRVTVRYGSTPLPGVQVRWHTEQGTILPVTSTTGADGVATGSWVLGPEVGTATGWAEVERRSLPLVFQAYAEPGPPANITFMVGEYETYAPSNWPYFDWMQGRLTDRYGNDLTNVPLTWSVAVGQATFISSDGTTGSGGWFRAFVAPAGVEGPIEVRVGPTGTNVTATYHLTATAPQLNIRLNLRGSVPVFVSGQNGSSPAVDTIPAGSLMTWIMDGYDYFDHRIVPSNGSAMPDPGAFPPYEDQVQATFTVPPGTYTYEDLFSGAHGTVVVE